MISFGSRSREGFEPSVQVLAVQRFSKCIDFCGMQSCQELTVGPVARKWVNRPSFGNFCSPLCSPVFINRYVVAKKLRKTSRRLSNRPLFPSSTHVRVTLVQQQAKAREWSTDLLYVRESYSGSDFGRELCCVGKSANVGQTIIDRMTVFDKLNPQPA